MKKTMILLMTGLIFISGCGKKEKLESPVYSHEDVPEGYYIKKDDKFYPLLSEGISKTQTGMFQWFTGQYDKLIPELGPKDSLVFISSTERPDAYEFHKMIDYGYTVGIKFDLGTEGSGGTWGVSSGSRKAIRFPNNSGDFAPSSPVGVYIKEQVQNARATKLVEINDKEVTHDLFSKDGFTLSLTKDAFYKYSFYEGTQFKAVNLKADTHLYIQEEDGIQRTTSHTEERSKFFTINLPQTMSEGNYLVAGSGLFKYNPEGTTKTK